MAWRFRKSVNLGGGVRLNFSKKGVGVSAGVKGFRVGVGPRGAYRTTSIPGTGLYNQEYINKNKKTGGKPSARPSANAASIIDIPASKPALPVPDQLMASTNLFTWMTIISFVLLFVWWQAAIAGFIGAIIYYNQSTNTKAKKLYESARAALLSGNTPAALESFNKVLVYDQTINLDQELAATHSASGNKQQAISHYENCLQATPNDSELKERLIDEYFQNGDYEKTVDAIQSLPSEDRQELPMINMLGSEYLKLDKPDLALEVLLTGPTRKRKMTDDLMRFRYLLGLTYQALGQPKKAINQLNKVYVEDSGYENVSALINELTSELPQEVKN